MATARQYQRFASSKLRSAWNTVPSVLAAAAERGASATARRASGSAIVGNPQSRQSRAMPSRDTASFGSSLRAAAKCSCAWSRTRSRRYSTATCLCACAVGVSTSCASAAFSLSSEDSSVTANPEPFENLDNGFLTDAAPPPCTPHPVLTSANTNRYRDNVTWSPNWPPTRGSNLRGSNEPSAASCRARRALPARPAQSTKPSSYPHLLNQGCPSKNV